MNDLLKKTQKPTKNPQPGPNDTVAKSSANGLVGTGFASQYQLQTRFSKAHSSLSLTSNRVTTKY